MFRPGTHFFATGKFVPATVLLLSATFAAAQHRGGHGVTVGTTEMSRPDGVDEKDTLKDFHHALAVQARTEQIAEFQQMVKSTSDAQDKLHAFAKAPDQPGRGAVTTLDQSLEEARTRNKKFQEGFSESQKSGLKEITRRLDKSDSDLDQETKRFDQSVQSESATSQLSAHAESLDKALANFSNEQLALGREMGITLASGQDLTFNLPKVRNHATIGARIMAVDVSGLLSQTAAEAEQRTFRLEAIADLSELQRSITEILNSQLVSNRCGSRLAVRRATIVAASPASSLVLQLHYERWSCLRLSGQSSATELAESDGTVEIKLTPAAGESNALRVTSEFKRIDAPGVMADDLRSGDLGDTLREKVSSVVLSALQAGADFKSTLPGALQNGVTLKNAKFEDPSNSGLKAVLQGQVRLSNEQVNLLASQLNQTLSAQGAQVAAPAVAVPAPQRK